MIYVNEDYQDEDTVLERLIHDFHCIDPNEMYSEVFKKWMKYYKEEKEGVIEMCEICEQLKEMGRVEKAAQMTINLLIRKLGSLSDYAINKINNSNEMTLDILALNIFDINREEDILKYVH